MSSPHHFPPLMRKIDRGFSCALEPSPGRQALVNAIDAKPKALAMKTVAEGVETEAQTALLREAGCSHMRAAEAKDLTSPPPARRFLSLSPENSGVLNCIKMIECKTWPRTFMAPDFFYNLVDGKD